MNRLFSLVALGALSFGITGCSFNGGVDKPADSNPPAGQTTHSSTTTDANGNVVSHSSSTTNNQ